MDDLALLLHADGIPQLILAILWVASGLAVAPVVAGSAREERMGRSGGWALLVAVLGPLGVAAFLVARRRHRVVMAALVENGIELPPREGEAHARDVLVQADGAARSRGSGAPAGAAPPRGTGTMVVGGVMIATGLVLSLASPLVFVGLVGAGGMLVVRGLLRRQGPFRG